MAARDQEPHLGRQTLEVIGKGIGFLALIAVATRYLLPSLLHSLARWPELLTLFAIAWAIGLASLGTGLGFSKEVGAFVAGVALAATPYKAVLAARLVGLRDFLLLFFFIDLGCTDRCGTPWGGAGTSDPAISDRVGRESRSWSWRLVGGMRYAKHTAITTGLTMGQISEFSLILAALGVSLGHIDKPTMGLITLIGLITFGLSTYMILYSHWLYRVACPSAQNSSILEYLTPKNFKVAPVKGRHASGRCHCVWIGSVRQKPRARTAATWVVVALRGFRPGARKVLVR